MSARRLCRHCGCELLVSPGDECESLIGWCALITARRDSSEEAQLIADAVAEFSRLDDERKASNAG